MISAKENIADGPEGIILESMLEGMAEYYSAELSVKVIRGHTENKCPQVQVQWRHTHVWVYH